MTSAGVSLIHSSSPARSSELQPSPGLLRSVSECSEGEKSVNVLS